MASCDYCGSTILFGGSREGDFRFCNDKCRQGGALLAVASQIPPDVLAEQVKRLHQGPCPSCGGEGPWTFRRRIACGRPFS